MYPAPPKIKTERSEKERPPGFFGVISKRSSNAALATRDKTNEGISKQQKSRSAPPGASSRPKKRKFTAMNSRMLSLTPKGQPDS